LSTANVGPTIPRASAGALVQAGSNYSVKWTAATSRGNLMLSVAAATYLKR